MIIKKLVLVAASLFLFAPMMVQAAESVASPNGNVVVTFDVKDGIPVYKMGYKGRAAVKESRLGLELFSENGRTISMPRRFMRLRLSTNLHSTMDSCFLLPLSRVPTTLGHRCGARHALSGTITTSLPSRSPSRKTTVTS